MKTLAKALGFFVVLMIALLTFGERFLKVEHLATRAIGVPTPELNAPTVVPAERQEARAASSDFAKACAQYDPIAHPEQIAKILLYASSETETPAGALFGVWQKETGNVDGAGILSGGCKVMPELKIRDGAAGTHHGQSMLRMADVFGWKTAYGENLERMTCSCPKQDKETGERLPRNYGGSCGPFQFSAAEVDDKYAIPLHLDPMTFCGGALIVGWELKRYHEIALKAGHARNDGEAWLWAMDRYLGSFDGLYSEGARRHWEEFQTAYDADPKGLRFLRQMITKDPQARWSIRHLPTFASN